MIGDLAPNKEMGLCRTCAIVLPDQDLCRSTIYTFKFLENPTTLMITNPLVFRETELSDEAGYCKDNKHQVAMPAVTIVGNSADVYR